MFEEVWSTDDFPGLNKSGTELFFTAADRIGCNMDDVMYFDDNIIAVENAGKSGFYTVGVYDYHYDVPMEKVKAASKKYIISFEEML
jgi:FMN phosphatase YigB (HAD superfamily)